ncbi:MAG TPA: CoA transferase [Enteractinococcus sp.]
MTTFPQGWTVGLSDVLTASSHGVAPVSGPRYWWGGPLDVEGLALGSTRVAATALQALTGKVFTVSAERVAASFASLENLRVDGRQPQGFAPLSGFRRTADGWIRLHANYPHHEEALKRAMQASSPHAIAAALASSKSTDAERAITEAGGVAASVKTREEWQSSAEGSAASTGPWLRFLGSEDGKARRTSWRMSNGHAAHPLHGLRILDLTRVVAGPSASRLLAALGADVLRVDPPDYPELTDLHIDTGFCKRSIELDFKRSAHLKTFRELLRDCHVIVLGYRPRALERFGLAPQALLERWPALKVVSFNAWGFEHSAGQQRGFDSIVQAACGIADIYRKADGSPGSLPVQALDHATGMGVVAAVALLLADYRYAHAQASLARTAHELLNLSPVPSTREAVEALEVPTREVHTSAYGLLQHVPPPLLMESESLEYSRGPVRYGSSEPTWL